MKNAAERCPACGRRKPGARRRTSRRWKPTKLRIARRKAGVTRTQLADEVGVNRKTIARWENGTVPSEQMVARLNKVLDASLVR